MEFHRYQIYKGKSNAINVKYDKEIGNRLYFGSSFITYKDMV